VLAAVKDEPFGWPQERPSLTAAAHDGQEAAVGAEECLRRGRTKEWTIRLMLGQQREAHGDIFNEATVALRGTFLGEAIRVLTLIVAPQ
jgi:hypothetical protein